MARNAEGWKLKWPRDIGHVRFTHGGHRYEISTGERDPLRAAREAAQIYARTVSGRARRLSRLKSTSPLDELVADWIADYEAGHERRSARNAQLVATAQWITRWRGIHDITTESGSDYQRDRLREVTRSSVQKELSMLRQFLEWCEERGFGEAPEIKAPPTRATGVRSGPQREKAVVMTEAQAKAVLRALPVLSERTHTGRRFRVRDYFIVLWETGLRPTTVQRLETPLHFLRGQETLVITDRIDKNRAGRSLPLTQAARAALERSLPPKPGIIFGSRDLRAALRKAAVEALGEELGPRVARYDFRHSRLTAWGETTTSLVGLQHLAGHASASTTARYLHASARAAEAVLVDSGAILGPPRRRIRAKEGT